MRRAIMRWAVVGAILVTGGLGGLAQPSAQSAAPVTVQAIRESAAADSGGRLHGVVKSGSTPLPGVTVTAQDALTGKRFQTTTSIAGAWALSLPRNGRYVIRTQFAAFAPGVQEAVLDATSHERTVNFELVLAWRGSKTRQPVTLPSGNWPLVARRI